MEDTIASEVAKKAVWIESSVSKLNVVPSASNYLDLYCDNSGVIAQAKEPKWYKMFKHVLWRYYLIREIINWGDVMVYKVHTDQNVADPLTNPLRQPKHETHMRSMGIRYLHHRS
jgi:hypothetical protein